MKSNSIFSNTTLQFLFAILLLLQGIVGNAQAPSKFSYQAVIRNASGGLVTNQIVGIRIRILQGSSTGTIVYAETHSVTTNTNGLVNIEIGAGTVLNGNFSTINWASGPYFLRTDTDPLGGTFYSITSNTQLLSVPYALYAATSGNGKTILNGTLNPNAGLGNDGDFYINTNTNQIFGPKASSIWGSGTSLVGPAGATGATGLAGATGTNGINGKTILNGTINPSVGIGTDGDFYINKATNQIFGPKTSGVWGAGTSLIGATGVSGTNGTNGSDGKTILSGISNPLNVLGTNGDFYINMNTNQIFGPKSSGVWGPGTSLTGPTGANGANGTNGINGVDGKTILHGTSNPLGGTGANGDFYINTLTDQIFGPKTAGAWGIGTSLIGPSGANGVNGTDGKTILNGINNPSGGNGVNGDFYINTSTNQLFGPKTGGAWGSGVSLVGPSGISSIQSINGIEKNGDTLKLGGRLNNNTTIVQDGFPFQLKDNDGLSTSVDIAQLSFSPVANLSATATTQTFTPLTSAKLASIRIRITAVAASSITLTVKNNVGVTLGSVLQNYNTLTDGWSIFTFSQNILQTMGQVHTISVTGTAGTTWYYSSTDVYVGGQSSINSNRDFAFETSIFTEEAVLSVQNQKVGIGTSNPASKLDISGKTRTSLFQLTSGASNGALLVSDANGNGNWTNISSLPVGNLDQAYDFIARGGGRTIIADSGAVRISGEDGLLITGTFGAGDDAEITGNGTRLFFNPKKAAFRAGTSGGSFWDKDSIGIYSVAIGINTKAKGVSTVAMGNSTEAIGNYATAFGNSTKAQGISSLASGMSSEAIGTYSTALGYFSKSTGNQSFAFGENVNSKATNSTTVGYNSIANGYTSLVIGQFNDTITAAHHTMRDTTALFIIGNGTSTLNRKNAFVVRNDNRVGIGTSSPKAALHVKDSSVVFANPGGAPPASPAPPPISGAGARMMWYADKRAFRAGNVLNTEWDQDSIGNFSAAFGASCKAKGVSSFAAGTGCDATGDRSFAAGYNSFSSGDMGVAIGYTCQANGEGSAAIGQFCEANGNGSAAIGLSGEANGYGSFAAGYRTQSNGFACSVFGMYNDTILAPQTGGVGTQYPLFIVGNGNSYAVRTNAMTVLKNGNVGLGSVAPIYQLELSSNSAGKPTSSTWTISSDARLKTVDGKYTKGLKDIIALETIRFHYNEGNARNLPIQDQGYGFVAQDLQKIFPEAVQQNKDGYLSIDMHPLLVAYVNAFKEQQQQLNKQQLSIDLLIEEIKNLKKSIQK
jgi:hypothetical protein